MSTTLRYVTKLHSSTTTIAITTYHLHFSNHRLITAFCVYHIPRLALPVAASRQRFLFVSIPGPSRSLRYSLLIARTNLLCILWLLAKSAAIISEFRSRYHTLSVSFSRLRNHNHHVYATSCDHRHHHQSEKGLEPPGKRYVD